jgi:hypothetical protein
MRKGRGSPASPAGPRWRGLRTAGGGEEGKAMDFWIEGSRRPRPASARTLYCDGTADAGFRPEADLELSHWLPNRTPARFKASSSTEICLKFVASADAAGGFELAVNNHTDIDGALSLFAVVEPEIALAHRRTLVEAAEIGDFLGWGDDAAMALCQALKLQQQRMERQGADPVDVYAASFALAREGLAGARPAEVEPGLAALRRSVDAIESGLVAREVVGARFVHYRLPAAWAEADLPACLHVPSFSEPLSDRAALWPQARARLDSQRVQLVSVPAADGWFHDLWLPGYVWAETVGLWRPAGLVHAGDGNGHRLEHEGLAAAAEALNRDEPGVGRWQVARTLSPFAALEGRGFPVVLSFMHGERPAPSGCPPEQVRAQLAPLFAA